MPRPGAVAAALASLALFTAGAPALGHGIAGKRFFPTTLTVDDPFVSDELSLPTVSSIREPGEEGGPSTRATDLSGEYSKTILPNLGLSLESEFRIRHPDGAGTRSGFGNLGVGLKYQFVNSARHEAIVSLGLDAEIGNTGDGAVGAESFTTLTPTLFFGKGFGDLPDGLALLRPLALTGVLGGALPLDSTTGSGAEVTRNPHVLQWGLTLQYSLPYLQSFVKDLGIGNPFSALIPVVEFAFQTPLDRGQGGRTTGRISPGLIWRGQSFQIGIEMLIPVNERTGENIGVIGQVHFFLDDIFPRTIGKPLLGSPLPAFEE